MSKSGKVFLHDKHVGSVGQDDHGYWFHYREEYLESPTYGAVSLTLPLRKEEYRDEKALFAFFDGLIPEGWLLDITLKNWKLDDKDRMELLLTVCRDCIGAASIIRDEI
jgi:serine/threonine-protein kinase HipA